MEEKEQVAQKKKNTSKKNGNGKEEQFWADQIAKQVISREKYHYTDSKIKKPEEFVVKTSASLSGVLHIGRLSDTIRGDSVVTALKDAGVKTKFIWVAEDMDPLRKIPKGVPKEYEKYLGMPVTDVPDPEGSDDSYAKTHCEELFKVVDQFVSNKMERYSMREEYQKGTFKEYVKKILEQVEPGRDIQDEYRTHPLPKKWSPWKPICENCGKIITTKTLGIQEGKVLYKCEDYEFETTTAKGCGHKGESDPAKGEGKLVWKSEWAAQWARWGVSSEGAGKEYQVPNSAWWINGEIVEKILEYPMPVPIFYEHLMIDGVKMSASLGNVVYPKDWLNVAPPHLLRLVYNKRLMTTRTFSWRDLPGLYAEWDHLTNVFKGETQIDNPREKAQLRRLFKISKLSKAEEPLKLSFSHAAIIAQLFENQQDIIASLRKTNHYEKDKGDRISSLLEKAKYWLDNYAPEESRFVIQETVPEGLELSEEQKKSLRDLADVLEKKDFDEQSLFQEFYEICKKNNIKNRDFFQAAYKVLLNRDRGPKLASFILILGKEKTVPLFKSV